MAAEEEESGFDAVSTAGLVRAAGEAQQALAARFGSADPAARREPRKLYAVQAQGVSSAPRLEFFDRGTFSQAVELGPSRYGPSSSPALGRLAVSAENTPRVARTV